MSALCVAVHADQEPQIPQLGLLRSELVERRLVVALKPTILDVANHADDLKPARMLG